MANDNISDLIYIDTPVFVAMAVIYLILSTLQEDVCMEGETNVNKRPRTLGERREAQMQRRELREKMLVLEDETCRTYVEGQPKAKEYLNKPIPFFEELHLVAGNDHATGNYARSIYHQFGGANIEDETEPPTNIPVDCEPIVDSEPIDTNNQRHHMLRSSASNTTASSSCAPSTYGENIALENFLERLGELTTSINNSQKKTWKEKFSDALWDMEGYDDADMEIVFERLIVNKKLAENFYLRKPSLRKRWLDNYIASIRDVSP